MANVDEPHPDDDKKGCWVVIGKVASAILFIVYFKTVPSIVVRDTNSFLGEVTWFLIAFGPLLLVSGVWNTYWRKRQKQWWDDHPDEPLL